MRSRNSYLNLAIADRAMGAAFPLPRRFADPNGLQLRFP
jgi:hypothetical protein